MNCCDYNCHQGRDCPARQACELPHIDFAGPEPRPNWLRVCDAIGVALGLGIVICIAALAVGVWA